MVARRIVGVTTYVAASIIILVTILSRLFFYSDHTREDDFEYGLVPGMTRQAVVELEGHLGGSAGCYSTAAPQRPAKLQRRTPGSSLSVSFVDQGTPLTGSGKCFALNFDPKGRLMNWTVGRWEQVP